MLCFIYHCTLDLVRGLTHSWCPIKCLLDNNMKEQEEQGALTDALYPWSLSFTIALQGSFDYPHFTDEETEIRGVKYTIESEYNLGWTPKSRMLFIMSDEVMRVSEVGVAESWRR